MCFFFPCISHLKSTCHIMRGVSFQEKIGIVSSLLMLARVGGLSRVLGLPAILLFKEVVRQSTVHYLEDVVPNTK